jgi:type III pantothenate kinase
MAALFRSAAKLSRVSLSPPEHAIGRNTEENTRSGVFFGAVAAIDGIVTRIAAELGGNPTVVATGGLSSIIAAACSTIGHVDPMLTLDGIRFLASTP